MGLNVAKCDPRGIELIVEVAFGSVHTCVHVRYENIDFTKFHLS